MSAGKGEAVKPITATNADTYWVTSQIAPTITWTASTYWVPLVKWVLICDKCGKRFGKRGWKSTKRCRAAARRQGWLTGGEGRDFCPQCVPSTKDQP